MSFSVMAGLVPAIHVVVCNRGPRCSLEGGAEATRLNLLVVDLGPTWMTGTSPVMTVRAADVTSPVSPNGVQSNATVDFVGDNRVIFDLGGNKYRLIVHVSFTFGRLLVKFIGDHAEYDRIDPETVSWRKK